VKSEDTDALVAVMDDYLRVNSCIVVVFPQLKPGRVAVAETVLKR